MFKHDTHYLAIFTVLKFQNITNLWSTDQNGFANIGQSKFNPWDGF